MSGIRRAAALAVAVGGGAFLGAAPATASVSPGYIVEHDVKGETTLAAPAATAPLTGKLYDKVDLMTGVHTYTLALDETKLSFRWNGDEPASARLQFATAGPETGPVGKPGVRMTLAVPDVAVGGASVGGGPDCATAPFSVAFTTAGSSASGPYHARFTLPPLTGCGKRTDEISAALTGPGNTMDLTVAN
ncbi:hypothetical protein [Actinomadura atramentaria]|uniref:hypothetical protein n=1 Tax=Actinomadura atramentaria TaxID=1990 RepID=UPI00037E7045|nr:hypothetical protein [Actinomadura atramentaria]